MQYNKDVPILKEIPVELLSDGDAFKNEKPEPPVQTAYQQAKFPARHFRPSRSSSLRSQTAGPGYDVVTRVHRRKFGDGLVTAITEEWKRL